MPKNNFPEITRLIEVSQAYIEDGAYLTARDRLLKAASLLEEEHVAKCRALDKLLKPAG